MKANNNQTNPLRTLLPDIDKLRSLGLSVSVIPVDDQKKIIAPYLGEPWRDILRTGSDEAVMGIIFDKKFDHICAGEPVLELSVNGIVYSHAICVNDLKPVLHAIAFGAEQMAEVQNVASMPESDHITFNRKRYLIRYLPADKSEVFGWCSSYYIIGPESLLDALDNERLSDKMKRKASEIDETIYFYVPDEMLERSEKELKAYIKEHVN